MNISFNWLKDLIDIDLSPDEMAGALTRVGLAVEGVHLHGDDQIFDVDLTSNRPDCLSHIGIAREISVISGQPLKTDLFNFGKGDIPLPSVLAESVVCVEDADLCHRFTARIIKNVKIRPSPKWLVDRLEAIGERSINNVADITNYVMHELGQPMHSFNLDRLSQQRIIVRRARPGEDIQTLDGVERKLDGSMLAICDAEKPIAIGGVMGGLDSSITENTANVLLEVAYFKRTSIRTTTRHLGLTTEASYRFERGVDVDNLIRASNRATDLICSLANGEAGDLIDVYPTRHEVTEITSLDISGAVRRLTGLGVELDRCLQILNRLGIESHSAQEVSANARIFTTPSWRHDLGIEEDLVEEVARHVGYENIAIELPPALGAGEYQSGEPRKRRMRQALSDTGFDEAISYSFIDTRLDGVFQTVPGVLSDHVTINDPVVEGAVRMRPSLLPGLLNAVRHNFNHQRRDIKLFEIGKTFSSDSEPGDLPIEQELLAVVLTGGEMLESRTLAAEDVDFFNAKGTLEMMLDISGVSNIEFTASDVDHLREGQSASVLVDGRMVGYVGRLADDITTSFKFRQPVFVAEINLQTVLTLPAKSVLYSPLSKYPGMSRDVSLLTKRNTSFASVVDAITEQDLELCSNVEYVDEFAGKGVSADERSLTIRINYASNNRTLLEAEVDVLHQEIIKSLEKKLGIQQRF